MSRAKPRVPETVDLLVIGAGAGGMSAALAASIEGLEVLLCEKTDQVGGALSTSAGTAWIPGNSLGASVGQPDTTEAAEEFLSHTVGDVQGLAQRKAFLASGPAAIDYFSEHSKVKFEAAAALPDYLDGPGAAFGGRALTPLPFDGRELKENFAHLRPPREEFLGLGGMMAGRHELFKMLAPFRSLENLKTTITIVGRYFIDRLSHSRGTRLVMGNALAGRLYLSLLERGVKPVFNTSLVQLIESNGTVSGAILETPDGQRRVMARRGVVLATGGISWHYGLRSRFFPALVEHYSLAPAANTGDGVDAALKLGSSFDAGGVSPAYWMPCSTYRRASDGKRMYWPHILLDRAKPGLLAVKRDGARFANEADSYHDFCIAQMRDGGQHPAFLLCDHRFIKTYGLGFVLPGGHGLSRFKRNGYLTVAENIEALAAKLHIDPAALRETVRRYNEAAVQGVDPDFGRGVTTLNRFNGDGDNKPNPCLAPFRDGPFYAVEVSPVDLATSAGLMVDEFNRVLAEDGKPIEGLYANGNDAASIFRGVYPGPGIAIGPALTFGWRIACHAAAKPL